MPKLTYDDFMTPFKGNSAISLRGKIEEFKQVYFEKYAKEILITCVYNEVYDIYTFFFKIPSGENDKYPTALLYDVIIEFSPKDKNSHRQLANINDYGILIYSNSPSFIFTFDYVVKHRFGFPRCVPNSYLSKVAISKPPRVRNTYELMTVEKTTWVCFYHLVHNGYMSKSFITPIIAKGKNENYFMKNVDTQPMKLKEIDLLNAELREAKLKEKTRKNNNLVKSYNREDTKKNPMSFSFKTSFRNKKVIKALEKHNNPNKFAADMHKSFKPGGK